MSPRNIAKDQELRSRRQKEILEAAMHVIARRGLPATKIADIATAAGLSVGNVYKYFTSKEHIFKSLVEMGQREYREFVEQIRDLPLSPLMKLHRYTEDWLVYRNGWAITIILQHARTSEAVAVEVKEAVSARFLDNLKPMAELIADAQREGTIVDGDPFELALIYVSLMEGLILHDIPGFQEISSVTADKVLRLLTIKNPDALLQFVKKGVKRL
ncbi:TetR/AcrR family transcriptional regulator [Paenibacillus sp. GCM10012307]|uniref:TetR/AcrR family transcriptional regulator n=1 Tax=Paenibacillus roseus TaxID=2798579 RepID=A0A934J084_9BACL|nr:TetR/AcrR family transcriptional regulator [Paenibacillus roseus]MBJ6360929.1 TetR/AcrR family transcriptional regulator [Paenibacillus roseus]